MFAQTEDDISKSWRRMTSSVLGGGGEGGTEAMQCLLDAFVPSPVARICGHNTDTTDVEDHAINDCPLRHHLSRGDLVIGGEDVRQGVGLAAEVVEEVERRRGQVQAAAASSSR